MNKRFFKRSRTFLFSFLFVMCVAGIFSGLNAKRATAENFTLHVWMSDAKMGDTPANSEYYAGRWYYLCYEILNSSGKRIGNSYGNYQVSMYQYDPSGKVANSCIYNDDSNWIGLQSGKTGRFRGHVYVTGSITVDCGVEWYQNDATPTLSVGASNVALNTEKAVSSTVVCTVQGDLSGLSYHLSVSNSNASVVTTSWGAWYSNGKKSNLTLSAKSAGTSVLTVRFLKSNGTELDTKTIIVTVTEPKKNTYIVSYDANGGESAPVSQIKKEGVPLLLSARTPFKAYKLSYETGCDIKAESRNKYCTFKNWNTSSSGWGSSYAPGSLYKTDSAATLYAVWENPTVSLDDLPILTREGYCFDGWYLTSVGGTKVTAGSDLVSNITLYAHWTPKTTPSPTVAPTIKPSALPSRTPSFTPIPTVVPTNTPSFTRVPTVVPTSTPSFTRIPTIAPTSTPSFTRVPTVVPTSTPSFTPVPTAAPTVRPTSVPDKPVDDYSFDKMYYSFTNSRSSFGYSASYKIPLNRYKMFFSDTQAQSLQNRYGVWSGSCFGFSASSIILNNKSFGDLSPSMFKRTATKVSDLSVTDAYSGTAESMTVTQMLEAMQVMQLDARIQYMMWNKTYANLVTSDLFSRLKDIDSGKAEPVVLGLYSKDIGAGHAVIPLGISYKSSTEDLLLVYDCNYGNKKRYITLYKNAATGAYTGGWYYYLNDTYHFGSSFNSYISYCDFDTFNAVWKGRAKTKMANIVCLKTGEDVDIYDGKNRKVAAIVDGEFVALGDSACEIHEIAGGITADMDEREYLFYLTEGTYTILPQNQTGMQLQITGEEKVANMAGTCAGVTFTVDGDTNRVSMQEVLDYTIKLSSADSAKDISMEGEANGESITAEQEGNQLTEKTPEPSAIIVPAVTEKPAAAVEPIMTAKPAVTAEPIMTAKPVVTVEPIMAERPVVTVEPNSTSQTKDTIDSNVPAIEEGEAVNASNGSFGMKMLKCKKVKKGKKGVIIKICYKAAGNNIMGYEISVDGTKVRTTKGGSCRLKVTRGRKHIIRVRSCYQNSDHSIRYSRWKKIVVKYK